MDGMAPIRGRREERHAVYRFYDVHETLLYVGMTDDPWRRWREHVYEKPWYPQVKHQAVTWYDSEWEARHAETAAIRSEHPRFNVAGALRPPQARLRLPVMVVINAGCLLSLVGLVLICTMFVAFPPRDGQAFFFPIVTTMCTSFLLLWVAFVIAGAPLIARFGSWLERNTAWEARLRLRLAPREGSSSRIVISVGGGIAAMAWAMPFTTGAEPLILGAVAAAVFLLCYFTRLGWDWK